MQPENMNDLAFLGPARKTSLPGEEGIWVFILGDMLVFGLFFVVYIYYRGENPVLFDAGQAKLNIRLGVINTLLLLTSSLFVVLGVEAIRANNAHKARRLLQMGALCGVGFVAVKAAEYAEKFSAGIDVMTNDFFMYYFMYTGIHLVHVVLGLFFLGWLISRCRTASSKDTPIFEIGASFWHMVDLLWIMLFPLLYLVK